MPRLTRFSLPAVVILLGLWTFWLRWPTFDYAFWNLDEGIYATVARTILEGGVMYRDAIDHRTPLCHYLTAAIFAVSGVNNVWAMHAVLAGMITATAAGLYLLGRRWRDTATGLWAAAVFVALSTDLLYIGDAYSLSTEWCLVFFTTWSAWWFWVSWSRAGFWPPFAAGVGYAAAFMSKQPGLIEVGAPVALLIYLAVTRRLAVVQSARILGGLVSGFTTLLALVFAYFWWRGALDDFYFYGWAYNLAYYGADTTLADRLEAAGALPRLLGAEYPLLLGVIGFAILGCLRLLNRDRPPAQGEDARPPAFFLLSWLALSTAGAASAGRVHAHYYIQAMPALALTAAWLLGTATRLSLSPGPRWLRFGSALLVLAAAWNVASHPLKGRARSGWGPDSSRPAADFVKSHSLPDERIIVWGLYPDFYVFADRRPASRYLYTSFQTGIQPGKNNAPGISTDDVIVIGSLEELLREIDAARPVFFIDTSFGAQRLFEKYPLSRFPPLDRFVAEHYVEVESRHFRPHGFRVLMLKDSSRRSPLTLAGGLPDSGLGEPAVMGPAATDPSPREYEVYAAHSGGRLQRVELLVNDAVAQSLSFSPAGSLSAKFVIDFHLLGPGRHRLAARAVSASGENRIGPVLEVECASDILLPEQRAAFMLPVVTPRAPLLQIRAPYGAMARDEAGSLVFTVHAPSILSYAVPAGATRLRGGMGIRPGAYARGKPDPTDGAEFIIAWITPTGQRHELMRRLLRPVEEPADRGVQDFDLLLPADHRGGTLELEINSGRDGRNTSDWTYWSDLMLTLPQ